jgi:hypothetical protein
VGQPGRILVFKHPFPEKLRAKWETLSLQRDSGRRATNGNGQAIDFNNTDWINGVLDEKSF